MSDYSERGAQPVEDAATDDPPTVDEVLDRQRREHPEQARTAHRQPRPTTDLGADEDAVLEAGGTPTGEVRDGRPDLEGPNSA